MSDPQSESGRSIGVVLSLPDGWVELPPVGTRGGMLRRDPYEQIARRLIAGGAVVPALLRSTRNYLERVAPVTLEGGDRVFALAYVADRLHNQYAGRLDRETMLEHVRAGKGQFGGNTEYVLETYDHLREIGVRDGDLEWLSAKLRA